MARYALNLPDELKKDAERLAKKQGVSLNQFILWSVAEKVGGLLQGFDDPNFPSITIVVARLVHSPQFSVERGSGCKPLSLHLKIMRLLKLPKIMTCRMRKCRRH